MDSGADREQRFVALYTDNYGRVLAYVRRRVDDSTAHDLVAETFLVAWRRLDEATAGGLPWLYRTAHLTLRNRDRAERRAARTVRRLAVLPEDPHAADPARIHLEWQAVSDALDGLAAADRELLLLLVWEQVDLRTAASVIGCSYGAAAVRLHRARRKLRRLLPAPASRSSAFSATGGTS